MPTTTEVLKDVLKVLKGSELTSEERNYISKLSRVTGYSRNTISEAINFLENEGLVTRIREGKKKIIIINFS